MFGALFYSSKEQKKPYFWRALVQKSPEVVESLLIIAIPYPLLPAVIKYDVFQSMMHCYSLKHNTLQHAATHCMIMMYSWVWCNAVYCNTRQHIEKRWDTQHHTAKHCMMYDVLFLIWCIAIGLYICMYVYLLSHVTNAAYVQWSVSWRVQWCVLETEHIYTYIYIYMYLYM